MGSFCPLLLTFPPSPYLSLQQPHPKQILKTPCSCRCGLGPCCPEAQVVSEDSRGPSKCWGDQVGSKHTGAQPARGREAARLPWQPMGKRRPSRLRSRGVPALEGSSAESAQPRAFKLKWSQVARDLPRIVQGRWIENCEEQNECRHTLSNSHHAI